MYVHAYLSESSFFLYSDDCIFTARQSEAKTRQVFDILQFQKFYLQQTFHNLSISKSPRWAAN